jgi:hypothetical protein
VRFEVFMVKIQVEVFWSVMLCSVAVGYEHFRGPSCLHLQGDNNLTSLHPEDGGSKIL